LEVPGCKIESASARDACRQLPDAANLAIGGLVFGQFVASGGFSLRVALVGLALWAIFMGWAVGLAGKGDP
jgi:hypothetical protein